MSPGLAYALTALALWGVVQIPIRMAKAPGRVGVMVSMPVGVAGLAIILPLVGRMAWPDAGAMTWVLILLNGFLTFPLSTYMYFEAVRRAGLSTAAPMTRLTPLLIVLIASAAGIEPLSATALFAGTLLFIGGVMLAKGAHRAEPIENHRNLRIGLVYAFLAALLWAVGYILVKVIDASVSRALVTFYGLAFGAVVHWAMMGVLGRWKELRNLTRKDIICYSIQGIGSFALGYWMAFESITFLGPSTSSVITGCWPILGVIVGVAVFREAMNRQKATGVVLLIAAGVLATVAPWIERFLLTLR